MSTVVQTSARPGSVQLHGISWAQYEALREVPESYHVRMTFDAGELEIMAPSWTHERLSRLMGLLVPELTTAFGMSFLACGSVTLQREDLQKGCESDEGFYIENEPLMRGQKKLDLSIHPPPDLLIEIDITSSSLGRLPIYAAMRVPEVWRHDSRTLRFYELQGDQYVERDHSRHFPQITPADIVRFLNLWDQMETPQLLAEFRNWLQTTFGPQQP